MIDATLKRIVKWLREHGNQVVFRDAPYEPFMAEYHDWGFAQKGLAQLHIGYIEVDDFGGRLYDPLYHFTFQDEDVTGTTVSTVAGITLPTDLADFDTQDFLETVWERHFAHRDALHTAETALSHITINTGNSASIQRAFVTPRTIDILRPLVAAGGGRVPNMPFEFSLVEHPEGAATIDIRYIHERRTIPMIVGTICEIRSDEWWKHLLHTARNAGVATEVARPAATPWLGVIIISPLGLAIISSAEATLLGGLENALAWTWLRRNE